MKLLNSPFAFRAGGEGRGWGRGGLEELFIFSDPSCAASEHAWFGQPEPKCDSEAGSSPCAAQPGCSAGPDPGHGSRAPTCPSTGQTARAQPCHAWATTTTHITLLGAGAGVQTQSKKCKRRRGAAPTKRFLVTPRLNLPEPSSTSKPRSSPGL